MNAVGVLLVMMLPLTSGLVTSTEYCPKGVPRDGFLQVFGDHCYWFQLSEEIENKPAKRKCEEHGGTLVLVKTKGISNFLLSQLMNRYHKQDAVVHIGLYDKETEGKYVWEDGTPLEGTFKNWASGNPDDGGYFGSSEDCVVLNVRKSGKWEDRVCKSGTFYKNHRHFICQYKVNIPTTTTTTYTYTPTTLTTPMISMTTLTTTTPTSTRPATTTLTTTTDTNTEPTTKTHTTTASTTTTPPTKPSTITSTTQGTPSRTRDTSTTIQTTTTTPTTLPTHPATPDPPTRRPLCPPFRCTKDCGMDGFIMGPDRCPLCLCGT